LTESTRGSSEPAGGAPRPTDRHELEEELVAEGGAVPQVDARDAGDRGAPAEALGQGGEHGPGAGATHQGDTGGAGVKAAGLRDRASELTRGKESPALGGSVPSTEAAGVSQEGIEKRVDEAERRAEAARDEAEQAVRRERETRTVVGDVGGEAPEIDQPAETPQARQ
jgi:hypothetical protein